MSYFMRVEFRQDLSLLSLLCNVSFPLFCIYTMFFFSDPTVKIESTTMRHLHQNFPHYAVIPTQYVSVFMEEKIESNALYIYEKIRKHNSFFFLFFASPHSSHLVFTLYEVTLLCTSRSDDCNFPGLEWEGKKIQNVYLAFSFGDKSWPSTHWKWLEIWKKTFRICKCTLNGVKNIWEVRV